MNKILRVIAGVSVAACVLSGCGNDSDSSKKVESSKETSSTTENVNNDNKNSAESTKDKNEGLPVVDDSVVREFKQDTPENAIREFYANVSSLNEKEYATFYQVPDGYKTIKYSWECYGIEKIDVTKVEVDYNDSVPNDPIALATVQYNQKLKDIEEPLSTFTMIELRKVNEKWVIAAQESLTQAQDQWVVKLREEKMNTDEYKKLLESSRKFQEKNSEFMSKAAQELNKYLTGQDGTSR
ncbi:hypothetical protein [Clostridium cellulovorans]|uniref:Lipoprotein n=1 Tax=Clostridium cellulovorans (strain ATCC 35296 / DSM 3052 / OCM 3 / 743B) TaxID=573061 RepID=D9SR37_CLOC7|nr:hypothetical protein [Clostridium cellulovorans]ADL50325.1 hypothetical protein Clocel_0552 [Clostridium cellulovorans 743B]